MTNDPADTQYDPTSNGPIIEQLLTPKELADWRANLENPETWHRVIRSAQEMLRKLGAPQHPNPVREALSVEQVRADELREGDRVWDDNGQWRTITGFGKWVDGSGRENWINAQLDDPILKMWLDAPNDETCLRLADPSLGRVERQEEISTVVTWKDGSVDRTDYDASENMRRMEGTPSEPAEWHLERRSVTPWSRVEQSIEANQKKPNTTTPEQRGGDEREPHTLWAMYDDGGPPTPSAMWFDTRDEAVTRAKAVAENPRADLLWLKVFRSDNEAYVAFRWSRPAKPSLEDGERT